MRDMFHMILCYSWRSAENAAQVPHHSNAHSASPKSTIVANSATGRSLTLRRMWQPNAALVPVDLVKCDRGGGVDAVEALE